MFSPADGFTFSPDDENESLDKRIDRMHKEDQRAAAGVVFRTRDAETAYKNNQHLRKARPPKKKIGATLTEDIRMRMR